MPQVLTILAVANKATDEKPSRIAKNKPINGALISSGTLSRAMATSTVVHAPMKKPDNPTVTEIMGKLLVMGIKAVAILPKAKLLIRICDRLPLSDLDPRKVDPMTPANRKRVTCNEADSLPIFSLR